MGAKVVRKAPKSLDDVKRNREAMEGHKPVVSASQRELIIKQANIIGEDGAAIVEDIEAPPLTPPTSCCPQTSSR